MTDLQFIEILEKWKRDEIGIETVLDAADAYSLADNGAKPIVSGSLPLCCMDCGRRYDAFGLDVVLLNEQWELIHPDEQGVLCAQCIVNRADKMGAIVALMTIDFGGNDR